MNIKIIMPPIPSPRAPTPLELAPTDPNRYPCRGRMLLLAVFGCISRLPGGRSWKFTFGGSSWADALEAKALHLVALVVVGDDMVSWW